MSTEGQAPVQEDWTKKVTLSPPNEVKFQISDEDKEKLKTSAGQLEPFKAQAKITLINKSQSAILFKVKTTNIKNYMVRPNAEVIPSQHTISVKIMTQHPIGVATKKLLEDRFLVQLAKLNQTPPKNQQMQPDDIARLWEGIPKAGLTQYKLKVDLNADVAEIIDRDQAQQAAGGVAPGLTQPQQKQGELFQSVRNQVMDMQLDHTVGAVKATKKSDMDSSKGISQSSDMGSKTNAGAVGLLKHQNQSLGGTQAKLPMVNEEAESEVSASEKKPKVPTDANQSVARKISEAQTQKYSLQSKLQRMKESKNFMNMKSNAMGSRSSQGNSEVSSGYKFHHLMIVAIIGMLAGAYIQLKVLSPTVAPPQ